MYLFITYIIGMESSNTLHMLMGTHTLMILYDILHYYFHFGPDFYIPIASELRRNHMKHHFRDSDRGFGVTTTIWDWVFGTNHVS
jgi:dihydroceramide fatty acyl 2-hydroxylase